MAASAAMFLLIAIDIFLIHSVVIESLKINSRIKVAATHQPPFSFRRLDGSWTGIEVRFLEILSGPLNFTFEVSSPSGGKVSSSGVSWASADQAIVAELASGNADLGVGGVHLIPASFHEASEVRTVYPHSQDCGAFLTQASVALPRHRAIMGPFHWKVWLSLTIAYVFASAPLALLSSTGKARDPRFSAQISAETESSVFKKLWRMIHRTSEAFWDVFGTFTNAFTMEKGWRSIGVKSDTEEEKKLKEIALARRKSSISRENRRKSSATVSWISSLEDKIMSAIVGKQGLRLLVAFYWTFTVIVSALYTGSIIAFITLPVFPKPYDTGNELLHAGFTWGTLASGDWAQWLRETDSPVGEQVRKLTARTDAYGCGCRGMRLFRSAEKGIRAVEQSSSLAFLSSRSLLTYLIAHPASGEESKDEEDEEESSLFSFTLLRKIVGKKRKGPVLAISSECFLPFRIGFLAKTNIEGKRLSENLMHGLMISEQAGLLEKGRRDADVEVGAGEEEEVNSDGKVVSSSEKRWRATHGQRLILGGGFRLGHGVLTERVLGLDDVQGIFLLLGAGFSIAFFVLLLEIFVVKIKQKCCPHERPSEDIEGLYGEFSQDEDILMASVQQKNLHYEELLYKPDEAEDREWIMYSDTIEYPRRTSAPAQDTEHYHWESLRRSITPRRAMSALVYKN